MQIYQLLHLIIYLTLYQAFTAVNLAELRLFNLTRWVPRHICKYNLMRTLISWQIKAEVAYLFLCHFKAVLNLNYSRSNLAKSFVRKPDNCNVTYFAAAPQEILYLYGINILATRDNNILLSVNKVDKSVLILFCHIPCKSHPSAKTSFVAFSSLK